jgi:hypothetical protein
MHWMLFFLVWVRMVALLVVGIAGLGTWEQVRIFCFLFLLPVMIVVLEIWLVLEDEVI